VSNPYVGVSDFFNDNDESGTSNLLWHYVSSLSPEIVTQLSKPSSPEVLGVIERNIIGLLGSLPSEHFNVNITTNRESLGKLLASAMISGYFLRNAEQRMNFEIALQDNEVDRETNNDEK